MGVIASPVRGQSDGVLNSPAIIMTTGSFGGVRGEPRGGRYTNSVRCLKPDASSGMFTGTTAPCVGSTLSAHRHRRWSGRSRRAAAPRSTHSTPPGRCGSSRPTVQRDPGAQQAQRDGQHGDDATPPALPRQPRTATADRESRQADPDPQRPGAGSPAMPCESMNQCAHSATATPTAIDTGSQISRHLRVRQPIAATNTAAATAWMTMGSQPCRRERPCR